MNPTGLTPAINTLPHPRVAPFSRLRSALQQRSSLTTNSLHSLYLLKSFQCSDLLQPNVDFERLYQLAHNAQIELEQLLRPVAYHAGARLLIPAVKGEKRAREKIATELEGQHRSLTDLARATLVAKDVNQIVEAYKLLSDKSHVVLLLNRFHTPKRNGYRDLKVLVRLPQSGMIAEVQVHLKAIEKVKNGEEHRIYQQVQRIERLAEIEQRPLSQWEQAKIGRLRRFSRALYEEAWQRYLPAQAVSGLM